MIASRDDADLGPAIASVADDLVDAEIVVSQHAPSGLQRFDSRTVALLNRGVPSFAVETDGTLHTALMRSCTGWPSGVWIDEPRRTAPDGSNFQLQHWTHVFDYALVCGAGDWRHAEIPARSAEFSHPLLAVTAPGRVDGLPATGSLLQVDPAGAVHLGALKAAGNPLAHGSAHPVDPGRGGHPAGRNPRRRHRCRRALAAGHGVRAASGRPAGAAAAQISQPLAHRAARLPDRHRAGATRPAPAARRCGHRVGPGGRDLPAALRAVLAAQPRAGPARRATRGGPPAPAPAQRRRGRRRLAARDRGQRQLRCSADRQRQAGVPARLVGQPSRAALHAVARRTPGSRRGADDARACRSRPVSGAGAAAGHRR